MVLLSFLPVGDSGMAGGLPGLTGVLETKPGWRELGLGARWGVGAN